MACKGLKNYTKGRTIQVSCGITHAARNIQSVFCLTTVEKVIPSLLPSVVEEVFDSLLSYIGTAIPKVLTLPPGAGCPRGGGARGDRGQYHPICSGSCPLSDTVLAVSNWVKHGGISYAVLRQVEAEFWIGMCRCDPGTHVEYTGSMSRLPILVLKCSKGGHLERDPCQTEWKFGLFRGKTV